jgi:hypothetical protein
MDRRRLRPPSKLLLLLLLLLLVLAGLLLSLADLLLSLPLPPRLCLRLRCHLRVVTLEASLVQPVGLHPRHAGRFLALAGLR